MYFSDAKNFRLRLLVITFCIDYHTFLDSKKCYCYRQNVRDQQDIKKNVMFKNCMFYFGSLDSACSLSFMNFLKILVF